MNWMRTQWAMTSHVNKWTKLRNINVSLLNRTSDWKFGLRGQLAVLFAKTVVHYEEELDSVSSCADNLFGPRQFCSAIYFSLNSSACVWKILCFSNVLLLINLRNNGSWWVRKNNATHYSWIWWKVPLFANIILGTPSTQLSYL